jgi:tetratricopeptide (TPR) repeat protein
MNDEAPPPEPPRLNGEDGETAELLRSADPEFREKLDESGAFRRIETTRRRRVALTWGLATAAAAAALVLLAQGERFGAETREITMTAEPLPPPALLEPVPVPPAQEKPAARFDQVPVRSPLPVRAVDAVPADEAQCRKLHKAGDAERALDCYRTLARAGGIGAEVASYQAARISAESLRDATRALRMLDEHAQRFPEGHLRGEVRWLRIQSLERAGRLDEALSESEAMLAAPEGRTLASDLHWLRARIYDGRSDCQRALSELVSLVGEPGARGDDAEMARASCFERLGRKDEARGAYERYLERAEPRRAEEAKSRIEALRP